MMVDTKKSVCRKLGDNEIIQYSLWALPVKQNGSVLYRAVFVL